MLSHSMVLNIQKPVACPGCGRIRVSLTCQAGDPVDSPVTWASAPADAAAVARDVSDRADGVSGLVDPALPAHAPTDAAAVARDVSDRADGVSGLVDPALPAHAPTGAVAAGDRRSVKRIRDGPRVSLAYTYTATLTRLPLLAYPYTVTLNRTTKAVKCRVRVAAGRPVPCGVSLAGSRLPSTPADSAMMGVAPSRSQSKSVEKDRGRKSPARDGPEWRSVKPFHPLCRELFPLVLSIPIPPPTPTPMVSSPRKERVVFAPKKTYSIERFINTRKRYGPRKFSSGF